jgi:anti-sigma B factor antagonist
MSASPERYAAHAPDGGVRMLVSRMPAATTIRLEGDWDVLERDATRHTIRRELACEPECLVLDLSRLSFMDSSGVHLVIETVRSSERAGVQLSIVPGPRSVQRIFEMCGLAEYLPFTRAADARPRGPANARPRGPADARERP